MSTVVKEGKGRVGRSVGRGVGCTTSLQDDAVDCCCGVAVEVCEWEWCVLCAACCVLFAVSTQQEIWSGRLRVL